MPRALYLLALLVVIGVLAAGAWLAIRAPAAAPSMTATVRVPGGALLADARGGPVKIAVRALEVDRTEVTASAFRDCVTAGKCKAPSPPFEPECNYAAPERGDHPMNCVTVADAIDYCEWRGARLPTTSERRYLALATSTKIRAFPWGEDPPDETRVNGCGAECATPERSSSYGDEDPLPARRPRPRDGHDDLGQPLDDDDAGAPSADPLPSTMPRFRMRPAPMQSDDPASIARLHEARDGFAATSPVGVYTRGATPEGLLDMAGNVSEWACDLSPEDEGDDDVLCWTFKSEGGSYRDVDPGAFGTGLPGRSARWRDGVAAPDIGFRCVR